MPEKETLERARRDKAEGKSPSTQAGEFVREEMEHVREGKHGARSTKQAIAIGLSKARRSGVELPSPRKGRASSQTRARASRESSTRKDGKDPTEVSEAVARRFRRRFAARAAPPHPASRSPGRPGRAPGSAAPRAGLPPRAGRRGPGRDAPSFSADPPDRHGLSVRAARREWSFRRPGEWILRPVGVAAGFSARSACVSISGQPFVVRGRSSKKHVFPECCRALAGRGPAALERASDRAAFQFHPVRHHEALRISYGNAARRLHGEAPLRGRNRRRPRGVRRRAASWWVSGPGRWLSFFRERWRWRTSSSRSRRASGRS
jgi:hypothetical protein